MPKHMFLSAAVLTSISLSARAYNSDKLEFNADQIKNVEVENSGGVVRISGTAAPGGKASVEYTKVKFSEQCRMEIEVIGNTLEISVEPTRGLSVTDCEVNFTVVAPKIVDVDVKSGNGDLFVSGTEGEVEYRIGNGAVNIDATVHKLDGSAAVSTANVRGLRGDAELKVGAGDVTLNYVTAPKKGSIDIQSGSGNAQIFLPSSAEITTKAVLGSGTTRNDFVESDNARFKVSVRTGSGDLTIKRN